jgi:hypothetical protein
VIDSLTARETSLASTGVFPQSLWNDTDTLAYFISFRTYALGCMATTVPSIALQSLSLTHMPPKQMVLHNQEQLNAEPLILAPPQRKSIEGAIRETCRIRKWELLPFNRPGQGAASSRKFGIVCLVRQNLTALARRQSRASHAQPQPLGLSLQKVILDRGLGRTLPH